MKAVSSDAGAVGVPKRSPKRSQRPQRKEACTVLVVDDSIFMTKQITQILTSNGFEIVGTAENGEEAIAKYQELKPDLVTMDINMPKMDGMTALKKIMESDPLAKVVMISTLAKQEIIKKSLMLGAKSYIVKPLDRRKVLERINSIL